MDIDTLKKQFRAIYEKEPQGVYFAPGRVNLIGEHIDYNGGLVFPCALSFGTYLLVSRRKDRNTMFTTLNFDHTGTFDECAFTKKPVTWERYPLAVMKEFVDKGYDPWGYDLLFNGDVPGGAGLSSSASIELVTATMLNDVLNAGIDPIELARMSQRAENVFVGMNSGIMDQFASAMGKTGHAIALDCATLDFEWIPLAMEGYSVVVANTNKHRTLTTSKYNERRSECEEATRILAGEIPLNALCELTPEIFEAHAGKIANETIRRRARHAVNENARVKEAIVALKGNDLPRFGQLMNASHRSLKEDYEVTGIELDTLAEEAQKLDGVLGSRMTGGGFGGCTVSLVANASIPSFIATLGARYKSLVGLTADFYIANVGDGARKLE
ncbi:MAG: galactokinase [Odoribacteraceae bacterium]|jgi:galactokinase|nr:galactokinase [Odoribacteraceae bacterium]